MLHRHLNHERFTLAAIDDVISRGRWKDWAELRQAVLSDLALLDKVERICRPRICDPYAQRYHFWMHYVEEHRGDLQSAAKRRLSTLQVLAERDQYGRGQASWTRDDLHER